MEKQDWMHPSGMRKKRKVLQRCFPRVVTLCCLLIIWSLSAMGQEVKRFSVNDVTLKEAVQQLERQVDVGFFYDGQALEAVTGISLTVENTSLQALLERLLASTGFTFEMVNGNVVIKKMPRHAENVKSVEVKGAVRDEKKQPMPGVTVLVKEMGIGTATDANGRYRLTVPVVSEGTFTLVFSFVGYETSEVKYTGQDSIDVVLKETTQKMDEVVVTGYGDVAKGNYTGAAYTVKAEEVLMAGASTIDQMLQGVIPGVLVMNQTGLVGSTPKIRVRGTSTLLGSQEPVWVVDGVIQRDPQPFNSEENTKFSVDADDIKELAGNAISWLNPNDIESITVLKDASATAIYGSQAANGVIVITTKKAQPGRVQVSYSGDFSIGQRPRYGLYDLMNSAERMELSREMYEERRSFPMGMQVLPIGFEGLLERYRDKEATIAELQDEYEAMASRNTDWFDILFRNSFNHSHNLSISGGSEKIQNRTSFSFTQENGEARGNEMWQFTATSNTTVNLWERVTVNMLLNGSIREVEGFAYGVDLFTYAYETSRVIPCYNEDGTLYYHDRRGTYNGITNTDLYDYNILHEKANTGSENRTRTWGTTIDLKWRILPKLEYQGLFAYTLSSSDTKQWATERSFYITQTRGYEYGDILPTDEKIEWSPLPIGGVLETDLTNTTTITVRNSLVYDKLFSMKHRLTAQLGIETSSVKTKGETNTRYGYMPERGETFATPPMNYLYMGMVPYENTTYGQGAHGVLNRIENKLSGYGMLVYTFDERYVLNMSGRVDASNRFGQDRNKRFQPTWSTGLKWRIGNESFAREVWWINNLDVYASYGNQGNAVSTVSPELITRFGTATRYNSANIQIIVSVPYPDLGWEKTETWNIGVDGSLLRGRLNFTFNYFEKTSDVLSSRAIPYENGAANGVIGGTTMKNYGYDLIVNIVPLQVENFMWQLSLNTSVTRNKVDSKRVNTLTDYTSGACLLEGRPFSTFYSYVFAGLDETYGQPLFKNMTQYGDALNFQKENAEIVESITDIMAESGKLTPDFSGGFNTMFKWKNISLYALFAIQWGGHNRLPNLYEPFNGAEGLPKPEQNLSRKLNERWRSIGDETDVPSLPGNGREDVYIPGVKNPEISYSQGNRYNLYNLSDVRVANTNFIRCRQLSLSYDCRGEWLDRIGLDYLQLKATMMNPFMWVQDKKWDGLDPETADWPTRRVMSFSLQFMF